MSTLMEEIVHCVPPDWSLAVLELTSEITGPSAVTLHHTLRNPSNWQTIPKIPRSLMLAATQLHSLYHDFGHCLVRANSPPFSSPVTLPAPAVTGRKRTSTTPRFRPAHPHPAAIPAG